MACVEVGKIVIVEVPSDYNPEKPAEFGHRLCASSTYRVTAPSTNLSRSLWYFAAAVWSMYTMCPDS